MRLLERRRRKRLAGEAAQWITRLDREDPKDERLFNFWWSRSAQHMEAAMDAAALENELPRALARVPLHLSDLRSGRVGAPRWLVATCAAAALLVISIGLYVAWGQFPRTIEYSTATGEQRLVRLEDNTSIQINTQSTVAVRYSAKTRSVELVEGEALFDVGVDPRPFQVLSGPAVIRDIGTRFNVRNTSHNVDVAVLSGQVQIALVKAPKTGSVLMPAPSITLDAGQAARIASAALRESGAPIRVSRLASQKMEERTLWTTGMLAFDAEPIYDVVAEVNRYNKQQLAVADAATGNVLVGGRFRADDLRSLLKALDNLGIEGTQAIKAEARQATIVLSLKETRKAPVAVDR